MKRATKIMKIGLLVAAILVLTTSVSEAGWWHRAYCGYGGCYPVCGPVYVGCYTPIVLPTYSVCCPPVRVGCCWRSCHSGCWSGCYSGCFMPTWPSACCPPIVGACCGATTTPAPAAKPAEIKPTPAAPTTPAAPAPATGTQVKPDNGLIVVQVPADAKVFVNGALTKSTGTERQYFSVGLKAGYSYKYDIRVEVERNGQTISESKSVTLTAGSRDSLAFRLNGTSANLAASF